MFNAIFDESLKNKVYIFLMVFHISLRGSIFIVLPFVNRFLKRRWPRTKIYNPISDHKDMFWIGRLCWSRHTSSLAIAKPKLWYQIMINIDYNTEPIKLRCPALVKLVANVVVEFTSFLYALIMIMTFKICKIGQLSNFVCFGKVQVKSINRTVRHRILGFRGPWFDGLLYCDCRWKYYQNKNLSDTFTLQTTVKLSNGHKKIQSLSQTRGRIT